MYGLVNRAVEEMVTENLGADVWEKIKKRAGIDIDLFVGMEAYPDEITYRLVAAASAELETPAEEILKSFGRYWVLYTGRSAYGSLLSSHGRSLFEFLGNLDRLHSHVGVSMKHLQPPSFRCLDQTEDSVRLRYFSQRTGLAPMVIGLIEGLASLFQTQISIEQTVSREEETHYDEFLIRLA